MHFLSGQYAAALQLTWMLAAVTAVFLPLEYLLPLRRQPFFTRETLKNLAWYFITGLGVTLIMTPPGIAIAYGLRAILPWKLLHFGSMLPLWGKIVAAMIVGEIGFYWGHRWSHEWPWLWRFHAVHHKPEQVNYLINTRGHPVDSAFTRLCGFVLLFATGLVAPVGPDAGIVATSVLVIGSGWSYFIHANLRVRLGLFEEVLASPAFHHWHHTYEDHKDRNYASMLPVLDRIFGTFYLPRHWPERYGTATEMPSDILGQLYEPFFPPQRKSPAAVLQREAGE